MEKDFADGLVDFHEDTTWLAGMAVLAEICVRLGRRDVAPILIGALAPWHRLFSATTVTVQGPVALHLSTLTSLLGERDRARAYLAEAQDVSTRLQSPYWTVRALVEQVRVDDGSTDRGDLVEMGLEIARNHGFNAVLDALAELT